MGRAADSGTTIADGEESWVAMSRRQMRAPAHLFAAGGHGGPAPLSKPAMLRRLYDWCIAAADKPYASWILGAVSFIESSFFPVPPDAMLIPMALARPERAYFYAFLCTWTSVAGGILGYFIGAALYDTLGHWLISLYGYGDKVDAFRDAYTRYGSLIILLKGITPIPYKIVTIASGFAGYNLILFVIFSFIARGMRFYAVAFLANRYGDKARTIIEERLGLVVTIGAILLVAGIVVAIRLV
jgi:membrane protein YqaA with SNARE-associated domain